MKLIKCENAHLENVLALYHRTIGYLENHINYPKWSSLHPSDQSIVGSVKAGELYVCIEGDTVLGAVVLSEDPEGYYESGDWSRELKTGEYLVIHALAVDPSFAHKGIGAFMVEQSIEIARKGGYQALRLDVVPENIPAERLYEKLGFSFAGTKDLRRNIDEVPVFDLFELNL